MRIKIGDLRWLLAGHRAPSHTVLHALDCPAIRDRDIRLATQVERIGTRACKRCLGRAV